MGLLCLLIAGPIGAADTGWVAIPIHDYEALRKRAYPAVREPEPAPLEATLSRVEYDLEIRGGVASGRATLTVDVLRDEWVRVPIPAGLLVREAKLDGKLVPLAPGVAGKPPSLVLSTRGRSRVSLDIAMAVTQAAGEEKLVLPSSAAAVTRAAVGIAKQDRDMKLSGGLVAEHSDSEAESRWVAFGRPNEPLVFAWRRKVEEHRAVLPLRLRGSVTQLVGLGEDASSLYAEVDLEVVQGAASQARVRVPENVTINQVLGASIADWEVKGGELVVTFLDPLERTGRFIAAGETRLPREGAMQIPLLELADAERESGGVAVEVLGAGEIKEVKAEGLERTDAAELGQIVAGRISPSLAAFRLRAGAQKAPRSLSLAITRYAQQAVLTANIEEARYRVLMTADGKALVEAKFTVRNNQRNFVRITLPANAVLWSASASGRPVHPGVASDRSLLFPLSKARAGEEAPAFPIEVLYLARVTAWEEKGRARLPLASVDLPVSRTAVELHHPPQFRVAPEGGSFRTEAYQEPSAETSAEAPVPTVAVNSGNRQPDVLQQFEANAAQSATQALVDRFRATTEGRRAMPASLRISFPAVGPSLFLVAELTGEGQAPAVDLTYQRDRKGGSK